MLEMLETPTLIKWASEAPHPSRHQILLPTQMTRYAEALGPTSIIHLVTDVYQVLRNEPRLRDLYTCMQTEKGL